MLTFIKLFWNIWRGNWRYEWVRCWVCDGGKLVRYEWLPVAKWFKADDVPTLPVLERVPMRCRYCDGRGRERQLLDRANKEVSIS